MKLTPLMRMRVDLGTRLPIGRVPKGRRNVWPIAGGFVRGPAITGTVMPVGGEFELIDESNTYHIDVRLVIRTDDGANIFVQYFGVSEMPDGLRDRYRAGETVDFGEANFVTQPRFETQAPRYAWLNTVMAIAEGRGTGNGVEYLMYHCVADGSVGLARADTVFAGKAA